MKILVILASYNGEKYIKEQIESILSQENVNAYIMIFDDNSNDKTVEVVNSFCNDKRVKLIKNSVATGSAANNFFNALKTCSNEIINLYDYISFADQDDIWLPNKLYAATQMLQIEKSNLYMSNLILWEEKTNHKSIINKCTSQKKYDFLFESGSAGCTYVFSNSFCIDLKRVLSTIDYAHWKYFSHDWLVYFYARINNYGVSIDSNAYILYRIHENNIHGQLNTNSLYAIKERIKLIRAGWYMEHIKGFVKLTEHNSTEKRIYDLYNSSYLTRLFVVLRYNFCLMRNPKKFIQFLIVSLIPIKSKNNF